MLTLASSTGVPNLLWVVLVVLAILALVVWIIRH